MLKQPIVSAYEPTDKELIEIGVTANLDGSYLLAGKAAYLKVLDLLNRHCLVPVGSRWRSSNVPNVAIVTEDAVRVRIRYEGTERGSYDYSIREFCDGTLQLISQDEERIEAMARKIASQVPSYWDLLSPAEKDIFLSQARELLAIARK